MQSRKIWTVLRLYMGGREKPWEILFREMDDAYATIETIEERKISGSREMIGLKAPVTGDIFLDPLEITAIEADFEYKEV